MRTALSILSCLFFLACSAAIAVAPPSGGGQTPEPSTVGQACTIAADCAQGEICTGPTGCDATWTCQPAPPCKRDLVPYCGCDGETFRASSNCPAKKYASAGACE